MMGRPAAFIDRDGTIIDEKVYLSDPAGVELIPGAVDAMRALADAGFAVVVVTNQSGIARGLYTLNQYRAVAARLDEILEGAGFRVDGTYFCPHHPDATGPCDCRKPGTGMYERAARELDLDAGRSWMIGDKISDVLPARALGGRGILVRTGYGTELEAEAPDDVVVVDDLLAAARVIIDDHAGSDGGS